MFADDLEVVDHTTGVTFDRQGELSSFRALLTAQDPTSRGEPLTTLGDSLLLSRGWISAAGFAGRKFDVAAYEREVVALNEVDANGRRRRTDLYAPDRLGDAIARLYERYADLLPDGPARARAAATARSVAGLLGPPDLDRRGAALAPAVEFVDHRPLGFPPSTGADAYRRRLGTLLEVSDDVAERTDDVLGLRCDALLVHWTSFGTDRASGGAYERPFLNLYVFGADGLATRNELFDADRGDEALARFDELVGSVDTASAVAPPAARFANGATRAQERFLSAMDQRDWDALVASYASGHMFDDRRSLIRTRVEGEAYFAHLRMMFP